MGMPYELYWEGDPYLAAAYRKAYRLRRETENEQAWLQGFYVFDAFGVCLANLFAKRGAKKQQYLDRPIDIYPLTEREKKRREAEENAKMRRTLEEMARKQRQRKNAKG